MTFEISRREMFLPMQVRDPCPNFWFVLVRTLSRCGGGMWGSETGSGEVRSAKS